MDTPPCVYSYTPPVSDGGPAVTDPVIELLSRGLLGGVLERLPPGLRPRTYYAIVAGRAATAATLPILGLVVGDGRRPPKPYVLALYRWLLDNPFTLAGGCRLAVLVKRGFSPGPGALPSSKYAVIAETPEKSLKVLYPGVASVCIEASRRGVDLLASLAKSVFTLTRLEQGPLVRHTLLAVLESLLVKCLESSSLGLGVVATYTTAYRAPIELVEIAQEYLTGLDKRGDADDNLDALLSNEKLWNYVFGDVTGMKVGRKIDLSNPSSLAKRLLDMMIDELSSRVDNAEAVVVDVTGRWSLFELEVFVGLAERLGARTVYLLYTPETHINLLSVYLLLIDAKNHNIQTAISVDEESLAVKGDDGVWVIPMAYSATDQHIAEAVARHITTKHGKRVIHVVGHPALATLVTLRIYRERGVPRENILVYPLSRYVSKVA